MGVTAMLPYSYAAVIIVSLGVLSHLCYFIQGEHHLKGARYIQLLVVANLCGTYAGTSKFSLPVKDAFVDSAIITSLYLIGLYSSIITYRLFFHRTRHFPGPKLVAVSKLWHTWLARRSQNHLVLQDWQRQYGDFVRSGKTSKREWRLRKGLTCSIGPNEITVFHPAIVPALHDVRSDCSKPDWYDIIHPYVSLNSTRSKAEHDRRRRVWNPSFATDALPGYDTIYARQARRLADVIRQQYGHAMEMRSYCYWWSFDVMGELMFSRSLQTLTHEHSRWTLRLLRQFMSFLGPYSPAPWIINLGAAVPGVFWGWKRMIAMCEDFMNEKIQVCSNIHTMNSMSKQFLRQTILQSTSPAKSSNIVASTTLSNKTDTSSAATRSPWLSPAQTPSPAP